MIVCDVCMAPCDDPPRETGFYGDSVKHLCKRCDEQSSTFIKNCVLTVVDSRRVGAPRPAESHGEQCEICNIREPCYCYQDWLGIGAVCHACSRAIRETTFEAAADWVTLRRRRLQRELTQSVTAAQELRDARSE